MKTILIIENNLEIGGVQKSLIALLQYLDYSQYSVDLFLCVKKGIFIDKIPREVNVLSEVVDEDFFLPADKAVICLLKKGKLRLACYRFVSGCFSFFDKGKAAYVISRAIPGLKKKYDVVIDYAGQYQLYYMNDKINAERKISYFHSDYKMWSYYEKMDRKYYEKVDAIVTVSDECVKTMQEVFPEYKEKIFCIENIISPKVIELFEEEEERVFADESTINLVSAGRVGKVKGFDYAIGALRKLIANGYDVKWYFIGPIADKQFVEDVLNKNEDLKEHIIMVGATTNPYKYMRNATIYVHPSRYEGKAIAIEEAKVLHVPIVVTNYSTVNNQIKHEKTGLIAEMNIDSITEMIIRLLENCNLRESIIANLKNECNGNEEEVHKLYALFDR